MSTTVRISPGDILKLYEKLRIRSFPDAASVLLAEHTANRSVALLLRKPGSLYVGSGVCVRVGNRNLVARAKHNLQESDLNPQISNFEVCSRGEKYGEPSEVLNMGLDPTLDLAWL